MMEETMEGREKKAALVTGAAKGIGRAVAEALAGAGFEIVIADILPATESQAAVEACRGKGAKAVFVQADISSPADRKRILGVVRKAFGRLDVLVNNAGVAPKARTDILEATEESYDWVMSVNLKGPYFLTQAAARWMIEEKQEDPGREPVIINIASISSYTSSPARGEYCVSKAGLSMMTKLFADRLSEFGIRVYEIRPGIIRTDMTATVREKYDRMIAEGLTSLRRWGLPEDIAKAAVCLATLALPYSTGEVINVDGGFHLRRLG
jgi:3-oxoacyl-[acyl-carrier protein] reductase